MRRRDFLKVPALAMILPYYSGLKLSQAKPIGCGIGIGRGDCKHCYHWTAEGLSRAMDSGFMFPGFSGETCHKCKRTANTLAGEAGWFCCCGEYNCQDLHYHQKPHKHPDLGPTSREIEKGFIRSRRYRELIAEQRELQYQMRQWQKENNDAKRIQAMRSTQQGRNGLRLKIET